MAHYPTPELAIERICLLIRRCLQEAGRLKDSEKHMVIAACMFAMYLSKNSALAPAARPSDQPPDRFWRITYTCSAPNSQTMALGLRPAFGLKRFVDECFFSLTKRWVR